MTRKDDEYDPFDPLMLAQLPEPEPESQPRVRPSVYVNHFDTALDIYYVLEEYCKKNSLFLDETRGFVDFADFLQLMIPDIVL